MVWYSQVCGRDTWSWLRSLQKAATLLAAATRTSDSTSRSSFTNAGTSSVLPPREYVSHSCLCFLCVQDDMILLSNALLPLTLGGRIDARERCKFIVFNR